MNVSIRFAWDSSGDQAIQPEEIVRRLEDLEPRDQDGDKVLKGKELEGLYFEYARDTWVPAGKPHRVESDGISCTLELRSLALKTGRIDLQATCRPA